MATFKLFELATVSKKETEELKLAICRKNWTKNGKIVKK